MFYYYIQKLTKRKKIKIDKVMSSQSGGSKKRECPGVHYSNPPGDLKNKKQTDS